MKYIDFINIRKYYLDWDAVLTIMQKWPSVITADNTHVMSA